MNYKEKTKNWKSNVTGQPYLMTPRIQVKQALTAPFHSREVILTGHAFHRLIL